MTVKFDNSDFHNLLLTLGIDPEKWALSLKPEILMAGPVIIESSTKPPHDSWFIKQWMEPNVIDAPAIKPGCKRCCCCCRCC